MIGNLSGLATKPAKWIRTRCGVNRYFCAGKKVASFFRVSQPAIWFLNFGPILRFYESNGLDG